MLHPSNGISRGNKAKGRIAKRAFKENKARQIFRKTNISWQMFFSRKIWQDLFSWSTGFEIHPFALLPTKCNNVIMIDRQNEDIISHSWSYVLEVTPVSRDNGIKTDVTAVAVGCNYHYWRLCFKYAVLSKRLLGSVGNIIYKPCSLVACILFSYLTVAKNNILIYNLILITSLC